MSFGFRKNLNTTPKKLKKLIKGETKSSKKQDKCNNFCEDESATDGTGNCERLTTAMGKTETIVNNTAASRDDNGNAGIALMYMYAAVLHVYIITSNRCSII